jgi:hypothetical protein
MLSLVIARVLGWMEEARALSLWLGLSALG